MPEKSTNEKWKFAYKLAVALVPAAVELCGFPKTLELLEKPLSALIEHLTGESVEWLFKEQGELEKTTVIIGNALKKLLEDERYNYLKTFFSEAEFDFSKVNLVSGENALADHFCDCYMEKYSLPKEQRGMTFHVMHGLVTDLFKIVEDKIGKDQALDRYWRERDTNETVHEIRDVLIKEHNHNADYINKWNEPLCLHRGEIKVTLADIFVMPEVEVDGKRKEVGKCVEDFIADNSQNILLLLGHGGYGKTSFIAHMAANETTYTDGRPLHIFRLREFADVKVDELYKRISEFSQNKLESNAVLVFDGLDELCMVGGGNETEKSLDLLTQLMFFFDQSSSYKIIITSRPEYISAEKALERLKKLKISAKHFVSYCYAAFSERQRGDLVDSIEKADPALKGSLGCEQVRKFEDEKDDVFLFEDDANKGDAIYGSPFLLYLICAAHEKLTPECFENRWLLFRTVFHDINPQPDYKKMQENTTGRGAVAMEHLDKLYRITSRLAYEIYKSCYKKQYFQKEEVLNVIRALYPDETSKLISALGDCYALCAYFKQTENGAVEFAHNHVRDFFLCEYILQGLDERYAERGEGKSAEECGKKVADWLSDRFKYAGIRSETDEFLKLAAKQKKIACPNVEQYFKPDELEHVFNVFCKNSGLHEYHADDMPISAQSAAGNVIRNSVYFLKILLPYTNGLILWFNVEQFNGGERGIIEQMRRSLNHADLRGANLRGADLSGADLSGADLSGADLFGANLLGANLSDADLFGADLFGANLSDANLLGVNLLRADLSVANLSHANLLGADLSGADLRGARYDNRTIFTNVTPSDFDPKKAGMIKVEE